jgi:hypothetical protein
LKLIAKNQNEFFIGFDADAASDAGVFYADFQAKLVNSSGLLKMFVHKFCGRKTPQNVQAGVRNKTSLNRNHQVTSEIGKSVIFPNQLNFVKSRPKFASNKQPVICRIVGDAV